MADNKPLYAQKILEEAVRPAAAETAEAGSAIAHRAVGEEPMLELRFKNGRLSAGAYSCLTWADYDPDTGIRLEFPTRDVVIEGHGLRHLFQEIREHKRIFVEELSSPARTVEGASRPHVSGIRVVKSERDTNEEDKYEARNAGDARGR